MPGVCPSPLDPKADKTSWWDFAEIYVEQTQQDFRPDLVARLEDGTQLLIEIAVTSFVDERKQEKINRLQEKAVEVDLRYLLSQMHKPHLEICRHILHDTQYKTWIYPRYPDVQQAETVGVHITPMYQSVVDKGMAHPEAFAQQRFTVFGMWLSAMRLPSGDLVVRSVAYNPEVVAMLKSWSHTLAGRYSKKYRNWVFPASMADQVILRLNQLHQDKPAARRQPSTSLR